MTWYQSQSWMKVKVAKWYRKKWNEHIVNSVNRILALSSHSVVCVSSVHKRDIPPFLHFMTFQTIQIRIPVFRAFWSTYKMFKSLSVIHALLGARVLTDQSINFYPCETSEFPWRLKTDIQLDLRLRHKKVPLWGIVVAAAVEELRRQEIAIFLNVGIAPPLCFRCEVISWSNCNFQKSPH